MKLAPLVLLFAALIGVVLFVIRGRERDTPPEVRADPATPARVVRESNPTELAPNEVSARTAVALDVSNYEFPSSWKAKWLFDPKERLAELEQSLRRFQSAPPEQVYSKATALLSASLATIMDADKRWEPAAPVMPDDPPAPPAPKDARSVIQIQDRVYRFYPSEFPEYGAVTQARGDPLKGETFPKDMPHELSLLVVARAKQAMNVLRDAIAQGAK